MGPLRRVLSSKVAERAKRRIVVFSGIHWNVKKLRPNVCTHLQTALLLRHFDISTVIDVGANTGQFAEGLLDFGFTGRIFSFEPVRAAHTILEKRARRYSSWTVYRRCAIGSEISTGIINVAEASVFSSLLNIEAAHAEIKPKSRTMNVEPVDIVTLDSLTEELEIAPQSTLLKIDTQGFERQVIEGARSLIQGGLAGIKTEMPLFPIYQNTGWRFADIYSFMREHGFQLYALNAESVDALVGKTTTLDGCFFRERVLESDARTKRSCWSSPARPT